MPLSWRFGGKGHWQNIRVLSEEDSLGPKRNFYPIQAKMKDKMTGT
jgi:hypothetical protein